MKHKSVARTKQYNINSYLYNAINKYGIENFSFEIIDECEDYLMAEREKYWIEKLDTIVPNGYNILLGGRILRGKDNPFFNRHHSQKTKDLISKKLSGRKASEDEKRMRRTINSGENNPFFGKHHTGETINKIKNTNIQNSNYKNTAKRMKENNPNNGELFYKPVIMIDQNNNIINYFASATEAGKEIKRMGLSKAKIPSNSISDVCRGIQKSAFGYVWRYLIRIFYSNLNEKTVGYIIRKK